LLFFVFASILTPPDVITQIMMAGPLILLYEVSILGARVFGKKAAKEDIEEPQESAG
jgi:sec-independent protein translocase protein TatC